MEIRVLLKPSAALPATLGLSAFLVQLLLERYFRRLARLARLPLLPWLGTIAWVAFGVQAAIVGEWAYVHGRIYRRSSFVAVVRRSSPRPIERQHGDTHLSLTSGRVVPVRGDAHALAEFLGIPQRSA